MLLLRQFFCSISFAEYLRELGRPGLVDWEHLDRLPPEEREKFKREFESFKRARFRRQEDSLRGPQALHAEGNLLNCVFDSIDLMIGEVFRLGFLFLGSFLVQRVYMCL